MNMPTMEIDVLRILSHAERDRGDFVSVERLMLELHAQRPGHGARMGSSLRGLRRQRFIVFSDGAVKITDSGIAALKSI
jgi:hypothetical protein